MKVNFSQGTVEFSSPSLTTIVVVAGGREPQSTWFYEIAKEKLLYAVDKGMEYCLEAGLLPKALYGDKDSGSTEAWAKAKAANIALKTFPKEKDDTDLQLLLKDLPPEALVIATGIWGGRFDHLYSNIFSLLAYKEEKKGQVILADDKEVLILLEANETVTFYPKTKPYALSLLPLNNENKVSLKGAQWPLNEATLEKLRPYAISNEIIDKQIEVACHKGVVGLYLYYEGE